MTIQMTLKMTWPTFYCFMTLLGTDQGIFFPIVQTNGEKHPFKYFNSSQLSIVSLEFKALSEDVICNEEEKGAELSLYTSFSFLSFFLNFIYFE